MVEFVETGIKDGNLVMYELLKDGKLNMTGSKKINYLTGTFLGLTRGQFIRECRRLARLFKGKDAGQDIAAFSKRYWEARRNA